MHLGFNGDVLQPGVALDRRLNRDKAHFPKPVKVSGLSCQMCQWDSVRDVN